jgi:adenylosuccinate synthase
MKRAIITVGLGFGDEGKGATVDFLTRKHDAELVVRYCGGSQAGHNVQLVDGRRHTFAQFGAGSLAPSRPRTYLGPSVVIDPPALRREAGHLSELGLKAPTELLTVHPRCLVTTYWLKMLNQLRELARGAAKHGSCGQGIGEARSYWLRYGADAVFAADLQTADVLRDKLELQRQRLLLELQPLAAHVDVASLRGLDLWDVSAAAVAGELRDAVGDGLTVAVQVPDCRTAVFEGAQGVLLDEYRGFHPYTTWSTVTPHHAWELVEQMRAEEVALLGIIRAYSTRHGEGPLPTFSSELTARLKDPGNPANRWQGSLRCGWLDMPLLRYAAAVTGPLDGIVVNHLDQIRGAECLICSDYGKASLSPAAIPDLSWQSGLTQQLQQTIAVLSPATAERIVDLLGEVAPVRIQGLGPTARDRSISQLTFRKRRCSAGSTT